MSAKLPDIVKVKIETPKGTFCFEFTGNSSLSMVTPFDPGERGVLKPYVAVESTISITGEITRCTPNAK